ncbi:hypothetical protein TNCV_4704951 [Trichonephila clavipes]|nr:hypothetical protein TNCV_4704951 [Trichonephila clavipes]
MKGIMCATPVPMLSKMRNVMKIYKVCIATKREVSPSTNTMPASDLQEIQLQKQKKTFNSSLAYLWPKCKPLSGWPTIPRFHRCLPSGLRGRNGRNARSTQPKYVLMLRDVAIASAKDGRRQTVDWCDAYNGALSYSNVGYHGFLKYETLAVWIIRLGREGWL